MTKNGLLRLNKLALVNMIVKLQKEKDEAYQYVKRLKSKGKDCDIYEDIKQQILGKIKGE